MQKKKNINSYLVILFIVGLISCSNEYRYKKSEKIRNNLYIEKYYRSDFIYWYLTDSIHFRKYIGRDGLLSHTYIDYMMKDSIIEFYKYEKPYFGKIQVMTETIKLNVTELQSEKIFE